MSNECITSLMSESSPELDTYPHPQLVNMGENKEFPWKDIKAHYWVREELVKRKAKSYALKILTEKQMKHSKMDNLHYSKLRLQTYFKIHGIQTKEVLNLFKWRVGMA